MARMRKPGWNPCEEFKIQANKKILMGSNEGSENSVESLGSRNKIKEPRMKTLAQATRYEIPIVKADIKAKLPKLSAVEVRRHRIPNCESVILELEEEGFKDAAEYLKMLFELDEETRKEAGPGSIVWNKPRLKNEKQFLERLRNGLTTVELAKRSRNLLNQATSLLELALFFESESWEWFWITEQLFKSSLKIGKNIQNDGGQIFNVIRYLYGRFLFEKMNDHKEALDYLDEVRVASEGKVWSASRILGIKQESLYRESCIILHKALLDVAKQMRTKDPEISVRAAEHALKRANDSGHDEYIAAALYELGKSQLLIGDVKTALGSLSKFLALVKRIPDPESVCNAHMELAFAYKEIDDSERTVKHFALLRECATKYKLSYKLAQAHYYTGEYLLNKNQAKLATPHLELALSQFTSLGKTEEADRARCIAGVSKGQEVMKEYVNLIINSQKRESKAIEKLCLWKTNRVPFWEPENPDESNIESIADISIHQTESINISEASTSHSLTKSSRKSISRATTETKETQKIYETSSRTKEE